LPRSDAQLARSVALAPERRCVVDGRSVSVTNPCGLQDARDFLREQLGVNLEPEDDDGAALDRRISRLNQFLITANGQTNVCAAPNRPRTTLRATIGDTRP